MNTKKILLFIGALFVVFSTLAQEKKLATEITLSKEELIDLIKIVKKYKKDRESKTYTYCDTLTDTRQKAASKNNFLQQKIDFLELQLKSLQDHTKLHAKKPLKKQTDSI